MDIDIHMSCILYQSFYEVQFCLNFNIPTLLSGDRFRYMYIYANNILYSKLTTATGITHDIAL